MLFVLLCLVSLGEVSNPSSSSHLFQSNSTCGMTCNVNVWTFLITIPVVLYIIAVAFLCLILFCPVAASSQSACHYFFHNQHLPSCASILPVCLSSLHSSPWQLPQCNIPTVLTQKVLIWQLQISKFQCVYRVTRLVPLDQDSRCLFLFTQ